MRKSSQVEFFILRKVQTSPSTVICKASIKKIEGKDRGCVTLRLVITPWAERARSRNPSCEEQPPHLFKNVDERSFTEENAPFEELRIGGIKGR